MEDIKEEIDMVESLKLLIDEAGNYTNLYSKYLIDTEMFDNAYHYDDCVLSIHQSLIDIQQSVYNLFTSYEEHQQNGEEASSSISPTNEVL